MAAKAQIGTLAERKTRDIGNAPQSVRIANRALMPLRTQREQRGRAGNDVVRLCRHRFSLADQRTDGGARLFQLWVSATDDNAACVLGNALAAMKPGSIASSEALCTN